jgi:hypothetical protein
MLSMNLHDHHCCPTVNRRLRIAVEPERKRGKCPPTGPKWTDLAISLREHPQGTSRFRLDSVGKRGTKTWREWDEPRPRTRPQTWQAISKTGPPSTQVARSHRTVAFAPGCNLMPFAQDCLTRKARAAMRGLRS